MREFLNALKWSLIFQVICWGSFILFDENGIFEVAFAMILGVILLIGVLIYYFKYCNKYLEKNNLNSLKFNISLFVIWFFMTIGMTAFLLELIENDYLHYCGGGGWDCFLNGIEYLFHGFFMVILSLIIGVIKIFICIYKFIKNKLNKKQD